jgi:Ni,Fe-hydrogenase I small subunit
VQVPVDLGGVPHLPGCPVLTEPFLVTIRNARIALFAVRGVPTLDAKTRP